MDGSIQGSSRAGSNINPPIVVLQVTFDQTLGSTNASKYQCKRHVPTECFTTGCIGLVLSECLQ